MRTNRLIRDGLRFYTMPLGRMSSPISRVRNVRRAAVAYPPCRPFSRANYWAERLHRNAPFHCKGLDTAERLGIALVLKSFGSSLRKVDVPFQDSQDQSRRPGDHGVGSAHSPSTNLYRALRHFNDNRLVAGTQFNHLRWPLRHVVAQVAPRWKHHPMRQKCISFRRALKSRGTPAAKLLNDHFKLLPAGRKFKERRRHWWG